MKKQENGTLNWISCYHVYHIHGLSGVCWEDVITTENISKIFHQMAFHLNVLHFAYITQLPLSKACICQAPSLNLGRPVSTCDPRCIPQLTHSGFSNFMSYNARAILKQWKTAGRNKERRPAQPAWTDLTRSGVSPKVSFRFSRLG